MTLLCLSLTRAGNIHIVELIRDLGTRERTSVFEAWSLGVFELIIRFNSSITQWKVLESSTLMGVVDRFGTIPSAAKITIKPSAASKGSWNDPTKEPLMDRNTIMKEFSIFAKDDWKVTRSLTLNLGVRWDYYGVPYLANGITVGLKGGGSKVFGPTNGYSGWFGPTKQGDTPAGSLVSLISIGPGSQNSGISLYPKTWTNGLPH